MKQKSLLLILALFAMQGMWAEKPIKYTLDPQIVEHRSLTGLEDYLKGLITINFEQIIFEYTSLGPDQKSTVRLTASINMPTSVYNKTSKARALLFYNQYTNCKKRERISQSEKKEAYKEASRFVLDISKLVFAGVILGCIMGMDIDKNWVFAIGSIIVIVLISFGVWLYYIAIKKF